MKCLNSILTARAAGRHHSPISAMVPRPSLFITFVYIEVAAKSTSRFKMHLEDERHHELYHKGKQSILSCSRCNGCKRDLADLLSTKPPYENEHFISVQFEFDRTRNTPPKERTFFSRLKTSVLLLIVHVQPSGSTFE